MFKHFISIVFLLGATSFQMLWSQLNEVFPDMEGVTLEDKTMHIPEDTKGKITLLGLAYSKKSDEYLDRWLEPIYQTFIHKEKSVFDGLYEEYDLNVYFIPMIRGINKAAYGTIEKKMKEGIEKKLQHYVMLYKGSLKPYKEILELDYKDKPYFFVLDQNGKVVYTTSGAYSNSKLGAIKEKVDALMEQTD